MFGTQSGGVGVRERDGRKPGRGGRTMRSRLMEYDCPEWAINQTIPRWAVYYARLTSGAVCWGVVGRRHPMPVYWLREIYSALDGGAAIRRIVRVRLCAFDKVLAPRRGCSNMAQHAPEQEHDVAKTQLCGGLSASRRR